MSDEHTTRIDSTKPAKLLDDFTLLLDTWRRRVDELLVQADLASMDAKTELQGRVAKAENAYLAAKGGIRDALADGRTAWKSEVRPSIEALIADLDRAYDNAVEAIRRTST